MLIEKPEVVEVSGALHYDAPHSYITRKTTAIINTLCARTGHGAYVKHVPWQVESIQSYG